MAGDLLKRIYNTLSSSDRVLEADNGDHNVEENIAGDSTCIDESEVSGCNSAISTDIEGIKLDMSILEARLVNIINENKSDISSLKIKLKELEGVIRYQDEVICKLSEDNLILKSKLCTIENLIPTVISDDHRDKKHVDGSTNLNHVNVRSKSPVIVQSTELNNASLPVHPFDSSSIDQVSLNVIHTDHINNHVNEPERVIPVNDECTSHGSDNSTTFNSNNPVSSEISTNVDSSTLNAMQDSDLRGNQHDLNTNPDNKESANQNINPEQSRHPNPEKGTIPCPFLKRRGWCVKGIRCDFKHPRDDEKHLVLCPFLQKRGYCLKGSRCDLSHSNSYSYSFPPSRSVNNFSTASILHHYRPTPIPQDTSRGIGANSFPQSFFQIYPRPLMEIPVHPPNPYAFRKHLCYRTPYVETLV